MTKENALLIGLRPFLPKLKQQAGEQIKTLFTQLITDAEQKLNSENGEAYASLMVVKTPKGEIHLLICAMSADDAILRVIAKNKADEFINQIMQKYL